MALLRIYATYKMVHMSISVHFIFDICAVNGDNMLLGVGIIFKFFFLEI